MPDSMSSIHHFYRSWWRNTFKILKPKLQLRLCLCHCQTGPRAGSRPSQGTKTRNSKVTRQLKKERSSCQAVLDLFDQQYSEELGNLWTSARSVLLDRHSWQHGVMLNRFSAVTEITQLLHLQGFSMLSLQTDVSALLSDGSSPVSDSNYPDGKDILLSHDPEAPPCDAQLPSDGTSLVAGRDPRSQPSLRCYIHPMRPMRFPSQAHRPGQLKQYYLLNAASLLPVLALQVKDGEKVLDLCSAPGGKALAILQSANPALLCCNEPDPHRRDWLAKTLESFLPQSLHGRVCVSAQDGRAFGQSEAGVYDKVLVDAPCSNDRSWLYSSDSQQGEQRLKERARLPALQAQLLRSALSAVRPGGVVVYSTCTLSSLENHAVVETVLNDFPGAEAEDLWEEIAAPLSEHFEFSARSSRGQTPHERRLQPQNSTGTSYRRRLGILVVPQPGKTWGPMFLSRIRRRK